MPPGNTEGVVVHGGRFCTVKANGSKDKDMHSLLLLPPSVRRRMPGTGKLGDKDREPTTSHFVIIFDGNKPLQKDANRIYVKQKPYVDVFLALLWLRH